MIAGLAVSLALAITPLAADSTARAPRAVHVAGVEGVPTDSATTAEFLAGFDEALSAPEFAIVAPGAGAGAPRANRPNRFVRVSVAGTEGAWSLQVIVRAPPPFTAKRINRATKKSERFVDPGLRASRGMTVALLVLSPEAVAAGARAAPRHEAFAFPQEAAPAQVVDLVPRGFRFPWREAGRVTAKLALEALHHRSGDLDEGLRCDLTPAIRAGAVR